MLDTQTPASHHAARSLNSTQTRQSPPPAHSAVFFALATRGSLQPSAFSNLAMTALLGMALPLSYSFTTCGCMLSCCQGKKAGHRSAARDRSAARTPLHYGRCSTHRGQLLLRDTLGVASLLQRQLQLRRHLRICPGMSALVTSAVATTARAHACKGPHALALPHPPHVPERGDGAQILQGLGGFRQWAWRRRTRALPGVVV
eukprot:scaffold44360_cov58-Phaeocystis_antarctica.AAC.2